jgi:hypothetical protein
MKTFRDVPDRDGDSRIESGADGANGGGLFKLLKNKDKSALSSPQGMGHRLHIVGCGPRSNTIRTVSEWGGRGLFTR